MKQDPAVTLGGRKGMALRLKRYDEVAQLQRDINAMRLERAIAKHHDLHAADRERLASLLRNGGQR
jgi:hypothetical protein